MPTTIMNVDSNGAHDHDVLIMCMRLITAMSSRSNFLHVIVVAFASHRVRPNSTYDPLCTVTHASTHARTHVALGTRTQHPAPSTQHAD